MPEVSVGVDLDVPAERAWRLVVDWAAQSRWMVLTRVDVTRGTGHAVGDELSAFTGVGRVGFTDTMTITAYDAPRRVVVRHTGRVVRGSAAFEVLDQGGGRSRFVWTEWLELPLGLAGRLGFALLRPFVVRPLEVSVRRFARLATS